MNQEIESKAPQAEKYLPEFSQIIGQSIAKERLSSVIEAARAGAETPSFLVEGEAGLGKTALADAFLAGMKKAGRETLRFSSPSEFRLAGSAYDTLAQMILENIPGTVYIDEGHGLKDGATVRLARVHSFLMKYMDGNNVGRTIRWDDENSVTVNPSRLNFILSTNFPDKLDKSGAFQSRCQRIQLEHYTTEELVQILQVMLSRFGFRPADEKTLAIIAATGRGTARPMEKIVQELRVMLAGKETVNRENVRDALRRTRIYPDGLNSEEIAILKRIASPMRDNVISAAFPNLEMTALRKTKGYMMSCGYAAQTSAGFQRTDRGTRYLEAVKAAGFAV